MPPRRPAVDDMSAPENLPKKAAAIDYKKHKRFEAVLSQIISAGVSAKAAETLRALHTGAWKAAQALLQKDALLVVEGEVAVDDFSGGMRVRAKRVMSLEDARTGLLDSVRINIDSAQHGEDAVTVVIVATIIATATA